MQPKDKKKIGKIEKPKKPITHTPQTLTFLTDVSVDRPVEEFEDFSTAPIFTPTINDLPDETTAKRLVANGVDPREIMTLLGLNPTRLAKLVGRETDAEFLREMNFYYALRRSTTCLNQQLNFQTISRKS
jgi:hypothetical protein